MLVVSLKKFRISLLVTYVLNQCSLVLEGVTLAQMIELVVEVLVDLAAGTVFHKETAENTETAHPDDLTVNDQNLPLLPSELLHT